MNVCTYEVDIRTRLYPDNNPDTNPNIKNNILIMFNLISMFNKFKLIRHQVQTVMCFFHPHAVIPLISAISLCAKMC